MPSRACLGCGRDADRGKYCTRCAMRERVGYDAPPQKRTRKYVSARDKVRQRDARWRELAKRQLKRVPVCEGCKAEGKASPAAVVDHIRPWFWFPEWRYAPENLQSLCRKHHGEKTRQERLGFLISYRERKVLRMSPEQLAAAKDRERKELAKKGAF